MSDLNALTLEPGEVVGGYTLISRLGSGAMGSVWRVSDDGGQVYAMKILRDSLSDEGDAGAKPQQDPNLKEHVTARERLRREAMALKRVNHPGVCGIVDMELDDALAFIVTELIEGKNLKDDVAANGRYVGDDLERLARKLIEAVKAVHAAGIVHRDIKPTNVMVSATGPILVDFGIAMGEGESHVTRTGLVMGTPGFIAPEIIEGAESDEATDWWSVASVLAFAAMGEPVFGTKPMMAVLEREASGNANLAGLPTHTLTAFRSALNPDPSKRCTPDQLLHAIALDALNPLGQGAGNGVVHPFGRDGSGAAQDADSGAVSTRTLWPGASGDDDATAVLGDSGSNALAATRALTPDQCTVALPSDRLGPDDVPGLLCPPPPPGATKVMPVDDAAPRASRPAGPAEPAEPYDPRDGMTDNPAARPVLRRIANNANQPATGTAAQSPRVAQSGQFAQARPARPRAAAANVPPAYVPASGAKQVQPDQPDRSDQSDGATTATRMIPPAPPAGGGAANRPSATTVMPQGASAMPAAPQRQPRTQQQRADQRTAVMSPIPLHPGQRPTPQPEPLFPPANPRDGQSTQVLAPAQPPQGTVPEFLRTPPQGVPQDMPPVMPLPMDQHGPNHANAADLTRDRYLSRGALPLAVMAVIPAIGAVFWPPVGLIVAAVLFWLLFTVGYSDTAQLDRESRRGGERKGSDAALRMVQLPWHLLKGLVAALARTAQFAAVYVLCMVFAVVALKLPWYPMPLPDGYWPYQIPWLVDDGPFTSTSLVAAGMAAVAWLLTSLWPYSDTLRLAAGAMRGRGGNQPSV